jgi:hypothetical protein
MSFDRAHKNGEDRRQPYRDRVSAMLLRAGPIASAVAAMAEDQQVQTDCAAIARDFAATEVDGLGTYQAVQRLFCVGRSCPGPGTRRTAAGVVTVVVGTDAANIARLIR